MPTRKTPAKKTPAKKVAAPRRSRGQLIPNLLLLSDFATGSRIFRVETELREQDVRAADFARIVALLSARPINGNAMVTHVHGMMDRMGGNPADKTKAKAMFAAAFGQPVAAPSVGKTATKRPK